MPHLFQLGDFTLNSGARSAWKIECAGMGEGTLSNAGTFVGAETGCRERQAGLMRMGERQDVNLVIQSRISSSAIRKVAQLAERRSWEPKVARSIRAFPTSTLAQW